jgi:hypothetical protein
MSKRYVDPGLIERPFDPNRKRYYLVDTDIHRAAHAFDIVNLEAFKVDPDRPHMIWWSGPIEVKKYAGIDADGYDCFYGGNFGMPALPEKPVLKLTNRGRPLDIYGNKQTPFLSTHAKKLLERIDPDAFDFFQCDAFGPKKVQYEPYWIMRVKRVVEEFDEAHSIFREVGGGTPIPSGRVAGLTALFDIRMSPTMPNNYHAFYLIKYISHYIFDEVIVDEWRKHKLTGLSFTPLQTPTKQEMRGETYFKNRHYYHEEYRHEWEDLV